MYYSKNSGSTLNIPRNYSGNTFRVIDETERERPQTKEAISHQPDRINENFINKNDHPHAEKDEKCEISDHKPSNFSPIFSLFSEISVEDILLLGLIFVIHQENPNDSTLLLLLILLLAK